MSGSKSKKILTKKHAREEQSKLKQNKNKAKLVPKKLKLVKKRKINPAKLILLNKNLLKN